MKHVIFLLLVALIGCDKNTAESHHSSKLAGERMDIDQTASETLLSYLDQPLQGKVGQRGLYRMVRSGGIVNNAKTSTGKAVANPVIQKIKSTDRIPLIKGAHMHLQYRIWYLPDQPAYVDLRRVLKHPEMTLPDGSVSSGSDFMIKRKISSNQVIAYTGYGFDEDYELVEGDWSFEIWHGDNKVIEQKFTTYWPDREELASLVPLLALGNGVLSKTESSKAQSAKTNWPRVLLDADATTGVIN